MMMVTVPVVEERNNGQGSTNGVEEGNNNQGIDDALSEGVVIPVSEGDVADLRQWSSSQVQEEAMPAAESEEVVKAKKGSESEHYSAYIVFLDKHPRLILISFLIFVLGIAIYGIGVFQVLDRNGFAPRNSESFQTSSYFENFDSIKAPGGVVVLTAHPEWTVDQPDYVTAFRQLEHDLTTKLPVSGCQSYFDYNYLDGMVSNDRKKALLVAQLPSKVLDWTTKPPYVLKDFKDATAGNPLTLTFGGELLAGIESSIAISEGLQNIELGGAPVLIGLMILSFNGVVAIIMPILLILWNIIMSFVCLRLIALRFSVTTYVTDVTLIFGVGLAIDFTLFMHLRFTEEMHKHAKDPDYKPIDAVAKMMHTSGRTVTYSAFLLCGTLSGILQFQEYYVTTMALAIMLPAALSCIGALTFLPALYLLLGRHVFLLSTVPAETFIVSHINQGLSWFTNTTVCRLVAFVSRKSAKIATCTPKPTDRGASDNETNNVPVASSKSLEQNKMNGNEYQVINLEEGVNTLEQLDRNDLLIQAEREYDEEIRKGSLYGIVTYVMTHPWPFAIAITACMVALMWIFLSKVRLANQSYGNFPLNSPSRKIFETVADEFPSSNGHGVMTAYVETRDQYGIRSESFLLAMNDFCDKLKEQPYVVDVTSLTTFDSDVNISQYISYYSDPFAPQNANFTSALMTPLHLTDFDRLAVISIAYSFPASDSRLGTAVRAARRLMHKSFMVNGERIVDRFGITGEMAWQFDLNQDIIETLPKSGAVIVILLYFFTLFLTNSIVLPLKAIICAVLSLCASFGFLVLVIQDGAGHQLLQFRNNLKCLDPLQLIFIFVVAFGLSLDYEVFLIGRIQEIYLKTGDNVHSVARGIQSSARSITLAAILLCSAVGSFLASEVLLLKQIGMGIGLTIILDATIVRVILVPALMALMGEWNWYAPKPVKRLVEYLDLKE